MAMELEVVRWIRKFRVSWDQAPKKEGAINIIIDVGKE